LGLPEAFDSLKKKKEDLNVQEGQNPVTHKHHDQRSHIPPLIRRVLHPCDLAEYFVPAPVSLLTPSLFFFCILLFFWFCGESYRSVAQRDEKKLNAAEKKRRVLDEREAGFLIFFKEVSVLQ
jgi:hypothetical protein